MPPHSLCASSSEPLQTSYLIPSTPSTPTLHRPLLAQDIKKVRNSKQLSLKVMPSPGNNSSNSVAPSPLFSPSTTSLSSRRPFTPAPLSSASLKTSACPPSIPRTPTISVSDSKRRSQLLLDDALPTPKLPLPSASSHRSISAYFSDYSIECGAASPYTSEPVCVLPNLYLGAEHNATDVRTLQRLGITFVLNVAIEIAKESSSSEKTNDKAGEVLHGGVQFKSLAWTHHQKNLLGDFPTAFALIDEALARNNGKGKALVHCQLGVSRSASLVIAYVMKSLGMSLNEAYDFVKERSGVISPNMSLMYQLAEYEKSLKNPGATVNSSCDAPAASPSKVSWSSQMDDDEPPYPFSAAFSAVSPTAATSNSRTADFIDADVSLTPATPIRQEFSKRPLTPDIGVDLPNTKPFHGPSKFSNPKSQLSSKRSHLSLQGSSAKSNARSSYQRTPTMTFSTTSSSSMNSSDCSAPIVGSFPSLLLKTPTTDKFSINLDISSSNDVEMVPPPTPFLRSSFSIPSLSSSSTTSSASSVSSFEACSMPSVSSTSTYIPARDDNDDGSDLLTSSDVCSPRNSGSWTRLASMTSKPEMTLSRDNSFHNISKTQPQLQQPEPKKKRVNPLWSGLKVLQVVADACTPSLSVSTSNYNANMTPEILISSTSTANIACSNQEPAISAVGVATTSTTTTNMSTITEAAAPTAPATTITMTMTTTNPKPKLPDFIFSPRSYSAAHHETRSFGDIYHALCMEG
ncbi:Dual specificity protein phosphatase 10 [Entomortierella beljakovae]|nr:Dual specificity protein phosphatase 10 [Entomortierella beljakovae]